jgi:hypothetical protein
MDRRVTEHIQRLVQYLNELEKIGNTPKDQFSENNLLIAATERYLQLARHRHPEPDDAGA